MTEDITALEEKLIMAIIQSDVAVLDELLHAELIFVNHLGMLVSKQQDLAPHLSGELKISEILTSDQHIALFENTAIVSVIKHIQGKYQENEFETKVRFLRTWKRFDDQWKVISASSVPVL
jgi:hypothetical protein